MSDQIHFTVYQTTNLINGKIYIGVHKTKDPFDSYLGSGKLIKRSIEKYGKENFIKEILFDFDNSKEAYEKEKEIVTSEFCDVFETYNICCGGYGPSGYSAEYRKQISEKRKGKTYEERYGEEKAKIIKEKRSEHQKNKKASIETRKKLSESHKGQIPWNKGIKNCFSLEALEQRTKSRRKNGITVWNKGKQIKWIHNNLLKKRKQILKDSNIPDGWELGYSFKLN